LQSLEQSFQQDLNLDGQTGPRTTTLEAFGSTQLDQAVNRFFLHDGAGNGPSLKYDGADVVAGQFGAWTLIGAENTANGYAEAWKPGAPAQYPVCTPDADANCTDSATLALHDAPPIALQSLEQSFQQDLNLDGQTGPRTTTLEAFGSTRLDQEVDR